MAEVLIDFNEQYPFAGTILLFVFILALTGFCAHLFVKIVKRVTSRDDIPLSSSSIFVNITRAAIWLLGISIALDRCFNIDASAFIAALGVGGIAISLGFQDTLSNLIGGLQISLAGLVQPGDYVEVLGQQGRVSDVTWRHTTILDADGYKHLIPNSLINKNSLINFGNTAIVSIPFVVPCATNLVDFTDKACAAVRQAIGDDLVSETSPCVRFNGNVIGGIQGTIDVTIERGQKGAGVVRTIMTQAVSHLIAEAAAPLEEPAVQAGKDQAADNK